MAFLSGTAARLETRGFLRLRARRAPVRAPVSTRRSREVAPDHLPGLPEVGVGIPREVPDPQLEVPDGVDRVGLGASFVKVPFAPFWGGGAIFKEVVQKEVVQKEVVQRLFKGLRPQPADPLDNRNGGKA